MWYNCCMTVAQGRLNILLPEELLDRLRAMAEDRDRSVSAETRRAIEERIAHWGGTGQPCVTDQGDENGSQATTADRA